jgi:hypothetical protein
MAICTIPVAIGTVPLAIASRYLDVSIAPTGGGRAGDAVSLTWADFPAGGRASCSRVMTRHNRRDGTERQRRARPRPRTPRTARSGRLGDTSPVALISSTALWN